MIDNLRNLPIRQKIGQLFFIGIPGPEIDDATQALLSQIEPGGVCLFSRNIREAGQTHALLDALRQTLPNGHFLSLDQEGGTVDRLRRIVTPIAAAGKIRTIAEAAELASLIGETISLLGFNMNFAPVVDVVDDERSHSSNGLFSRPFGRSKEAVVTLAGEFLRVLQQVGPVGCLKHFPGLGAARVDSHEELPVIDLSREQLFATDLYPYRELLKTGDVHAIMVAHASFPAVDLQERGQNGKLLPSSLSKNFITTLLRGELQYEGLVITDDLEMGAIVRNYGIGEACVMAVEAGADMLAICAGQSAIADGFEAVGNAVDTGRIGVERIDISLSRIAKVRSLLSDPPKFNEDRLAQLSSDIAGFNVRLEQG
jgi:beta-N-acetylhexosaminidase